MSAKKLLINFYRFKQLYTVLSIKIDEKHCLSVPFICIFCEGYVIGGHYTNIV